MLIFKLNKYLITAILCCLNDSRNVCLILLFVEDFMLRMKSYDTFVGFFLLIL